MRHSFNGSRAVQWLRQPRYPGTNGKVPTCHGINNLSSNPCEWLKVHNSLFNCLFEGVQFIMWRGYKQSFLKSYRDFNKQSWETNFGLVINPYF